MLPFERLAITNKTYSEIRSLRAASGTLLPELRTRRSIAKTLEIRSVQAPDTKTQLLSSS